MKRIPIYDATAPIACTAGREELTARLEQFERLRSHRTGVERTEHGLLLRFPNRPEVDAEVRAFAVEEKRCCTFWGFDVTTGDDEITLRWDGPPAVGDVVERLVTWFDGDEPLTALAGLL